MVHLSELEKRFHHGMIGIDKGGAFYHPYWQTGRETDWNHDPLGFAYSLISRLTTEITTK